MATWGSQQRSERRRLQRWLERWRASPQTQAIYRALQRRRGISSGILFRGSHWRRCGLTVDGLTRSCAVTPGLDGGAPSAWEPGWAGTGVCQAHHGVIGISEMRHVSDAKTLAVIERKWGDIRVESSAGASRCP
jgi:hypothetical protein